jgi:outer membrane receptor protein involved in Fe transport
MQSSILLIFLSFICNQNYNLMRIKHFLLTLLFALPIIVWAQVTTGALTGFVKSDKGEVLTGATVTAVHVPTGSKYTTIVNKTGQYTIPNVRVGGPYTLTIHFTGFKDAIFEDVNVSLGNPVEINADLSTNAQSLQGVTVVGNARGGGISAALKNGASTYISPRLIQDVPTVSRSVQDFAKLMPQAKSANAAGTGNGVGVSFAGQNNRYNQFSIDGASASDVFGLSSNGTNGGQSNINPISLEAIQEMQLILSPYDVAQGGFVGGGINAVTKSGTNQFHGALYGVTQPKGLIGKSASYNSTISRNPIYGDYYNRTYGASLGGAIIKNKLFFYVNYEHFEKSTPLAFDPTVSGSGSKVDTAAMGGLSRFLQSKYGYNTGTYGAISNNNASNSYFARLDWNINDKNKLVLRFNHVDGYLDVLSRSATSASFANSGYRINNKSDSYVAELNSSFSSRSSNVLRLTYSHIYDYRSTSLFPNISLTQYNSTNGVNANISYSVGSEFSSAANSLDQKVITVTDNLTLYRGKHTLTLGTNDQFFRSSNVFLQGFYGSYAYGTTSATPNPTNSFANFMNNTGMTSYGTINYSNNASDPYAPAKVNAAQFSAYVQDIWSPNSNFKLTYGLRVDLPVFFTKPDENASFNSTFASYGVSTNTMPKTSPLFSPRAGFNWDVNGDGSLRIRGGAGLFTGTVPFVWISNNFSNTGIKSSGYSATTPAAIAAAPGGPITFNYNTSDPHLGAYVPPAANAVPVINVVDKKFKFPQVFRSNIAADKKLNVWGLVSTFELVFTKTLNNAQYTNLNQNPNGDGVVNIGPTTRPLWANGTGVSFPAYVSNKYQQVIELSNTSKGYSFTGTVQIQKPISHGWSGSLAYTYGLSSSVNDLTSSVALSNWRSPITLNGLNNTQLSTSNYNLGNRIVGYLSKQFKYAHDKLSTTFTVIYTGQTGQGFSYVYGNNILGDYGSSTGATTLAYIPKTSAEANFADIKNTTTGAVTTTAAQQWANFQSFVAANPYLAKHQGENTERNGDHMPFENHFDFRIAQSFQLRKHKLEVYFDILNFSNLLNKSWGWSYSSISSTADGFFTASSTLFSTVSSGSLTGVNAVTQNGVVVSSAPSASKPYFNFNINNYTNINGQYKPYQVSDFTSRWNGQIGARYSF